MIRKDPVIDEGDFVAVPLKGAFYAIGLVARTGNRIMLVYFNEKSFREIPVQIEPDLTNRNKARLITICSLDEIRSGRWSLIKSNLIFDRGSWPVPLIAMPDHTGSIWFAVLYDDHLKEEKKWIISVDAAKKIRSHAFLNVYELERELGLLSFCVKSGGVYSAV